MLMGGGAESPPPTAGATSIDMHPTTEAAWKELEGMSRQEAMRLWLELVFAQTDPVWVAEGSEGDPE